MSTEDAVSELYMASVAGMAIRFNAQRPELRESGGAQHISGYASVFGKRSRNLGGFVEQIDRRAFDQSEMSGWPSVICRYNHDDNFLLGTTQGNTLQLRTDDTGLWYDVIPPSFRSDIVELCARGDVTQSSFAFRVPDDGDYWERSGPGGMPLRTVSNTELVDVAPVNTPAYSEATASARSFFDDDLVASLARFKECEAAEVRSYLSESGNVAKFFKRSDRPSAPKQEEEMTKLASDEEGRKVLTSKERDELSPSDFGYVDPDGKGHFPIHDAAHVRNALARIAQGAQYGKEALPKVKAAAKKFGIDADEQKSLLADALEEHRVLLSEMFDDDEDFRGTLPPWLQKAEDKKDGKDDKDDDEEDDDKDADSKDKKAPAKAEKKSGDEESEERASEEETAEEKSEEDEENARALAERDALYAKMMANRYDEHFFDEED